METTRMMAKTMQGWTEGLGARAGLGIWQARQRLIRTLREETAQGTTEYAILVGVLVVIAILAIVAFRDNVSALWEDITEGINSL